MQVDNSTLALFSKCHVAGALRYWCHRAPISESLPAKLGQCAHRICQAHLSARGDISDVIIEQTRELENVARRQPDLAKYLPENRAKLHSIATNLITTYPIARTPNGVCIIDPRTKHPQYYVRHTEIPFSLPIANGRHTIIGSIDAIVEDFYGHWRIFELKTSRYAGSRTWQNSWRLSTQPLTYEYAAQAHTQALVRGTLIVPFSTASLECHAEPIITIDHTPQALEQWLSNVITYLDWLVAIADEVGIEIDSINEVQPDTASQIISKLIPTGQFVGNCSNQAFGQCSSYGICISNYNPGYIRSQTRHDVWSPLETYGLAKSPRS